MRAAKAAWGRCTAIRERHVMSSTHLGPRFGYYPNLSKSSILVEPHLRPAAEELFGSLGIQIVSSSCFLGGFLGDISSRNSFVSEKVHLSALEQQLFSLPVRFGGLGVMLPSSSCESLYKTLWQAAGLIISAISGSVPFHPTDHFNYVLDAKCSYQHELDIQHEALFSVVLAGFDPLHQRALHRARVNDLSVWLSVCLLP